MAVFSCIDGFLVSHRCAGVVPGGAEHAGVPPQSRGAAVHCNHSGKLAKLPIPISDTTCQFIFPIPCQFLFPIPHANSYFRFHMPILISDTDTHITDSQADTDSFMPIPFIDTIPLPLLNSYKTIHRYLPAWQEYKLIPIPTSRYRYPPADTYSQS